MRCRFPALFALLFAGIVVLLTPSAMAQARAPGVDPTKKVLADPSGAPIYGWDADTDAADTKMRQACVLVTPDAGGGAAVGPTSPLPVYFPASYPGPVDLVRVGGAPFGQGQRTAATSLSVVPDSSGTRWPSSPIAGQAGVAAGAGAVDALTQRCVAATNSPEVTLLATIDADTSTLAGTVAGSEIQADIITMPACNQGNVGTAPWLFDLDSVGGDAYALGAAAPAASLSVVQDTTGGWTFTEASGATIAGHASTLAASTGAPGGALSDRATLIGVLNSAGGLGLLSMDASGNLHVVSTGTVTADQGTAGLDPWLVEVDSLPVLLGGDDASAADVAVDQSDDDTYAIPATATETICQNQSVDVIAYKVGSAASAAGAIRLCAESAAGDGLGCSAVIKLHGVTVYFYNETQNVAATVACFSELQ